VDRIILTGGVAHLKRITDAVCDYVKWIAPVEIMAGEFEMEALAAAGCGCCGARKPPES
jgi:butyrate kinase